MIFFQGYTLLFSNLTYLLNMKINSYQLFLIIRLQFLYKVIVLKSFAKFTGKYLQWNPYLHHPHMLPLNFGKFPSRNLLAQS